MKITVEDVVDAFVVSGATPLACENRGCAVGVVNRVRGIDNWCSILDGIYTRSIAYGWDAAAYGDDRGVWAPFMAELDEEAYDVGWKAWHAVAAMRTEAAKVSDDMGNCDKGIFTKEGVMA